MNPLASPPRAWAEIDVSALRHNLRAARDAAGCQVMAVVKAGAYGHGLEQVATALAAEDIAFFGVANVGEARRIADAGVSTRIYLLGATWSEERAEIVARDWTPCISSLDEARHFDDLARAHGSRLKVHLSVDTGMGRGGFVAEGLPEILQQLEGMPNLEIEGIGSHLSSADEDEEFTRKQMAKYAAILASLGGPERFVWRHLSNSAGLLGYERESCNLARPGLMLYGICPLPGHSIALKNVMSLKSRVTLVRTLPAGHGVSYGKTFVTTKPTRVATVGIGYGDGYPRHVSGHGAEAFIRGKRYPLIGRVTMDQIMVDVTDSEVAEGDEVEMFGPNIRVDEVAAKADTIAWEILTGITPRVVRVYA
ncbi:alanine racemase [Luteolibacter sp. GHJ8]|uniref:Alanine racemase n=1 Tax=Luteolibacter rhizosphaerae TaxID=2989719 RepID=A0ABT3G0D0_9BACT|nr:alanine racemase [Luteolibacter rhizosphaerae]MCW1913287.1 alanine racemase [Luteolibacter rhizosphaerae]